MIKKKKIQKQETFWISTKELKIRPQSGFYSKLRDILDKIGFGKQIRKLCEPYYSSKDNVRPPIDPEVYFKMLIIGFFENIRSERGICSRCEDSITLREFLGFSITESTPDHSTLSLIRHRLPDSVYSQLFSIILRALKDAGLVVGKNIAFDSSIIEANASLSKLQNRMTQESYEEYVKKLASEAGVDITDKSAVARFDRKRPDRKTSNEVWVNPHDPDAKIGKTKHGATDMVYKPEHAVDLDTGAIVDVSMLPGDQADSDGISERLITAQIRLYDIAGDPTTTSPIQTVTSDKGYFKASEIQAIQEIEVMPVIPDFIDNRNLDKLTIEERIPLCFAKAEVKSKEGKALLRRRGMYVERSFAHVLDSGGQRRTTLRKNENLLKRHRVAAATFNLSLLMRTLFGIGTPKQILVNLISIILWIFDSIIRFNRQILADFKILFLFLFQRTIYLKFLDMSMFAQIWTISTDS